jgi:hypothetical protein
MIPPSLPGPDEDTSAAAFTSAGSMLPHSPQNFFPGGILVLQAGHSRAMQVPHSSQNFTPSRLSDWQLVHFISIFYTIRIQWICRVEGQRKPANPLE